MSEPTYEVYRPTRHPVPEPPPERSPAPAYDERRRSVRSRAAWSGIPAPLMPGVICTVIWLMSGGGYFWPMWVFLPMIVGLLGRGGRRRC